MSKFSKRPQYKPARLIPTEDMFSYLKPIISLYFDTEYKDLSIEQICLVFNKMLSDFHIENFKEYINQFYSSICHPNMISFMEGRKHISNARINEIERLIQSNYSNPDMINHMNSSFIKELFVIGINHYSSDTMNLSKRSGDKELLSGAVATENTENHEIDEIKSLSNGILNQYSTMSTKYDPSKEITMFNINGNHGQGRVVPYLLSKRYERLYDVIYGNEIKRIMIDFCNPDIFDFDLSVVYTEYPNSLIEEQSIFVAKLFKIAPFGFVRKLLEVLFGYKAFEYFAENLDGNLDRLPFDRSKKSGYTHDTLISRIKTKMEEILKDPSKSITIQLWTKCYDISRLIYK